MTRAERTYVAACAAATAFALGYALPVYGRLPSLFYDPIARAWHAGHRQSAIPMGYVGQIAWAVGAALAAAAIAWLASGMRKRPLGDGGAALGALWTLVALALVGAYFTWNNWP